MGFYNRLKLAPKFILGVVPLLVIMAVAITWLPDLFVTIAEQNRIQESKMIAEKQTDVQTFLAKHVTGQRPEDPVFTIKYTSDKYRNPKDAPDAWEKQMIERLSKDKNLDHYSEVLGSNGYRVLRFAKPLYIQQACLPCHGEPKGQLDPLGHEKEGYKVGELRGAISVTAQLEGLSKEKVAMINLSVTLVVLLLTVMVIYMMVRKYVSTPLDGIVNVVKGLAQGDLTTRVDEHNQSDEIGELTRWFNQMIEEQSNLVGTVRRAADELVHSSKQVAATSDQVSIAASEVAGNIQHVARDASIGNESIMEATKVLHDFSNMIQKAKQQALSAADNSKVTEQAAGEGKRTIAETVVRMEKIKEKAAETEDHISTLSEYSQQIGLITDTITSLANQTNLLALNAAIEAARAGEAGRGFAVVAEEVRKLAEQSNQGATEVAALVRKIAESTAAAVLAMQHSRSEVEQGVVVVNKAGDVLEKILTAVDNTVRDIEEIGQVTEEEVHTSGKILELIQEIARIMENTAANAQEVAASTEQTSASMDTIAHSAEESNAMVTELKKTVDVFKIL
ncbi:DUF3365 domain-containing protein [Heliobacillus mobilis]|uniref:DUF3365 domain-containing protein n=1 Tax=Heliobacterium mobile TaxID=28064 RepID=A0A6I3SLG1_HELMO|nr:methyl-accepting chemotaxis protein [Heliobacterium mobile]MTV49317.1 DUF3365 domain-containing protein [Heliobacterium mobile]